MGPAGLARSHPDARLRYIPTQCPFFADVCPISLPCLSRSGPLKLSLLPIPPARLSAQALARSLSVNYLREQAALARRLRTIACDVTHNSANAPVFLRLCGHGTTMTSQIIRSVAHTRFRSSKKAQADTKPPADPWSFSTLTRRSTSRSRRSGTNSSRSSLTSFGSTRRKVRCYLLHSSPSSLC